MAKARKALGKKVRFEVFKRDSFTCQYCGAKAPDALLCVDHINPVSSGGENEIVNLITACVPCNAGKSDRSLTDDSVVTKQRDQLADLQERREQIELMLEWKNSLIDIDDAAVEGVSAIWDRLVPGFHLNETGIVDLRKLIRKYGLDSVTESLRASVDQYLELDGGKATAASAGRIFSYIGRIARVKEAERGKPYLRDMFYIRGIMRRRFSYVDESAVLEMLERAFLAGYGADTLRQIARTERNWTGWFDEMNALDYSGSKTP